MATYTVAPSALAAAILASGDDNPATTADQTIFLVTGGTYAGTLDLRSLSGGWLIPCIIRAADPTDKPVFTPPSGSPSQAVRMDSTMRGTAAGMPTFEDIVWDGWTSASNGILYTNSQPISVYGCEFRDAPTRTAIRLLFGTSAKPAVVDACVFDNVGQPVLRGASYNTVTNCRAVLPAGVVFDSGTYGTDTVVAHNSIYCTLNGGSGTAMGGANAYHGNIIINAGTGGLRSILGGTYSSNVVFGTFSNTPSGTDGGDNLIGTDPGLTDAANGDFAPASVGSAVVRAVARSATLLTDALGTERSDPTDIGALELYLEQTSYTPDGEPGTAYVTDASGDAYAAEYGWDPMPDGTASPSLEQLVYTALFTDARLSDDLSPVDGTQDRRGWWAGTYDGTNDGSLLWDVLGRAGVTAREVEDEIRGALAALVAERVCSAVDVSVVLSGRRATATVTLVLASGDRHPITFPDLWSAYA